MLLLVLCCMCQLAAGKVEETFIRTSAVDENGEMTKIFSNGEHTVVFIQNGEFQVLDCLAVRFNKTMGQGLLKQAILENREEGLDHLLFDLDVLRYARKCAKLIRDTKRVVEHEQEQYQKDLILRQQLQDGFKNTLWCSRQQLVHKEEDLGEEEEVDRCCQLHHLCKSHPPIPAVTVSQGVFNPYPWPVSHCACDRRFGECLRNVSHSAQKEATRQLASTIGRIFFNVNHIKCYVLVDERTCRRYDTWFNTCLEEEVEAVAKLRNLPKF